MPRRISQRQSRGIVYQYFLYEGWLPRGTTNRNWWHVTVDELMLDDPPLPSAPHLQKQRVALDLQQYFRVLGGAIPSPLELLKDESLTLGEVVNRIYESQPD